MPYASPSTRPRIGMLDAPRECEDTSNRGTAYCEGRLAERAFTSCRVATSGYPFPYAEIVIRAAVKSSQRFLTVITSPFPGNRAYVPSLSLQRV